MAKQLAATGNADAAFTAYSLVLHERGTVLKVDPGLYQPIEQALEQMPDSGPINVDDPRIVHLHFKDVDLSAGQITKEKAKKVRNAFRDKNLPICCISGYTNIIHPDKTERGKRVGYLKEILRNAREFIDEIANRIRPQRASTNWSHWKIPSRSAVATAPVRSLTPSLR